MKTASLEGQFEAASDFVREGGLESASVGSEEIRQLSLTLYGFYKQATIGDCPTQQPSYFDFVGRKKWQAWSDLKGQDKESAMQKYVEIVSKRAPAFAATIHGGIGSPTQLTTDKAASGRSASSFDEEHGAYFITGITGFIGARLAKLFLQRSRTSIIYALAFEPKSTFDEIIRNKIGKYASERIHYVHGDISKPSLGLSKEDVALLKTEGVSCFFHLAALYDLAADEETNIALNVNGTTYAVELANELGATFNYVSSIVVAGDYNGRFYENMYDVGQKLTEPYYKTKYIGEGIVRAKCTVPSRIYRPGIVIGSSVDGVADKIDGPYYLFKTIQQLRKYALEWMIFPMFRGETMPLVPVDYVVGAMDVIAHRRDANGKVFHLVDPEPLSFVDTVNLFAKAAHAPTFSTRITDLIMGMIPDAIGTLESKFPNLYKTPFEMFAKFAGIPSGAIKFIFNKTLFDDTETSALLKRSKADVQCPPLRTYAYKIWDHWERHLDPDLDRKGALSGALKNKTALVTGGDSGIGRAIVDKLLQSGARKVILVGREVEAMERTKAELDAKGFQGRVFWYKCDLAVESEVTTINKTVLAEHPNVDILINNAGRSIRRSIQFQYDRLHDFKRTIELNYYGSVAMMLGFLPQMREQKYGHIINISSIGAQTNQPRFGAYAASKAALDTLSRCINSEITQDNVLITTVYMPLVKTRMIAPTAEQKKSGFNYYNRVAITPEQAAEYALKCIYTKQRTVSTTLGNVLQVCYWFSPALVDQIFSVMYKIEPEKVPDGQAGTTDDALAKESIALLHMSKELVR